MKSGLRYAASLGYMALALLACKEKSAPSDETSQPSTAQPSETILAAPATLEAVDQAPLDAVDGFASAPDPTDISPTQTEAAVDRKTKHLTSATFADYVKDSSVAWTMEPEKAQKSEIALAAYLGMLRTEGEFLLSVKATDEWKTVRDMTLVCIKELAQLPKYQGKFTELDKSIAILSAPSLAEWTALNKGAATAPGIRTVISELNKDAYQAYLWGQLLAGQRYQEWITEKSAKDATDASALLSIWSDSKLGEYQGFVNGITAIEGAIQQPALKSAINNGIDAMIAYTTKVEDGFNRSGSERVHDMLTAMIDVAQATVAAPDEAEAVKVIPAVAMGPEVTALLVRAKKITEGNEIGTILMFPDPIDKIMQFDSVLPPNVSKKQFWKLRYDKNSRDYNPSDYTDKAVALPILFGIRLCDGFFAVQIEDANALRRVAEDLKAVGKELGGKDEDLQRADHIPRLAENNEWVKVVTELTFLREDVLGILGRAEFRNSKDLVLMGAWIQAATYVCPAVVDVINVDPPKFGRFSSILREPDMVITSIHGVLQLEEKNLHHPIVLKGLGVLVDAHETVNIPPREPVDPREKVAELGKKSSEFVDSCIEGLKTKKQIK